MRKFIKYANPAISHWEIERLVRMVRDEVIGGTVLEIGVHRGGSALVWKRFLFPHCLVGIDYDGSADAPNGMHLITGRSQDPDIIESALAAVDDRIDFLFIDGGHREDEVASDWSTFFPAVRRGGVIALHDIHAPETDEVQVALLWDKIRYAYKTAEIWDPSSTGIGVVFK